METRLFENDSNLKERKQIMWNQIGTFMNAHLVMSVIVIVGLFYTVVGAYVRWDLGHYPEDHPDFRFMGSRN